jgi:hypothetical protein
MTIDSQRRRQPHRGRALDVAAKDEQREDDEAEGQQQGKTREAELEREPSFGVNGFRPQRRQGVVEGRGPARHALERGRQLQLVGDGADVFHVGWPVVVAFRLHAITIQVVIGPRRGNAA